MSTWGAASAFEIPGSRVETYNRFEMTAKVSLICPWDTRDAVIGQVSAQQYPLPTYAADRYYPAYPRSFDVSVWEEKGDDSDVYAVSYTKAKIDVSYTCKAKNSAERSLTQTCSPVLNMRRLPSWEFYWMEDGSPVLDEESPTMMQVMLKISRQISGIRQIPSWWWECAGCVNDALLIDTMTRMPYEAETLLFIPSSATKQVTTNPDEMEPVWDIGFDAMWNPIGWNQFMRLNAPTAMHGIKVDRIGVNGLSYYMYPRKTFPQMM